MASNAKSAELVLRVWRQLYQAYTLLKRCEDGTAEEFGLTTEQYAVLVTIEYLGGPSKVTDIAEWLERSTNSISMIVDRMVKVGLVTRRRDTGDRRVVYVGMSSKGAAALKPVNVAAFETVSRILSSLSSEEKTTLLDLLGAVKYGTMKCLSPGVDIEEVKKQELHQAAGLKKWLNVYGSPSFPRAKRQGREKKTKRKNA